MEKNLPSAINGNTNGWKKRNIISFKKLSLTCFVSAFVFLAGMLPGKSFAQAALITINSSSPSSVCPGENVTIDFTVSGVGTNTYTFQLSDNTGDFANTTNIGETVIDGNASNATTDVTIPSDIAAGSGYLIRIKSGIINSTNFAELEVYDVPSAPTATDGQRCATGTVDISATSTGNTIKWYTASTGGSSIATTASGETFTTPSITSTTTYYASAVTPEGCVSSTRTAVTATVNDAPSAPTATDGQRCATGTVDISATSSGNTIKWYTASTGGTSIANTASGAPFTTPSISTTTTYYAEALTSGGCISSTRTAVVATINTVPAAPTGTNGSRCGTGTVNISAASTRNTITWYTASTGGTSIATTASGATFTTPSISSSTTYYAEALTSSGCVSSTRTAVVATVNTVPSAPTGINGQRCGTGTVAISATPGAGETIDWYAASTGGTALSSGSTSYTTPSISTTTTYYAQARNTTSGCISSTRTAVVATVNAVPAAPTGTGGSRCGTGTVDISATSTGNTINWYTASTGGTSIANTASGAPFTTPSISATTTYYAEALTSGGCISSTRTAVVATINTVPAAPTGTNGSRCGTGTVNISAASTGNTITWYTASTGGTSIATTASGATFTTPSISSSTTYYASAVTPEGCISSTRTAVVATVNTVPSAPTGINGQRCGTGTVAISATPGAGETIDWYAASTGGTALSSGSTSYTTPSISTTTTYYVQARNTTSGCISSTRTAVVATVNAVPAAPTGTGGSRCGTGTVDISATSTGNTINWYTASTGGTSIANTASGAPFTTPSISTTTTYYAEALTSVGCVSATRTPVTATVGTAPAAVAGTPMIACADATQTPNPSALNITGGSSATGSVLWGTTDGNGTFTNTTSLTSATYTPSAADKTRGFVTLTLTASSAGCSNAVSSKTLTITPAIDVNSANNWTQTATCSGNGVQFALSTPPTGGNGTFSYQWMRKNNCGTAGPSTQVAGATSISFLPPLDGNCYWLFVSSGGCSVPQSLVSSTTRIKPDPTVATTSNINFSTSNTTICQGSSTTLTAQSAVSYTYSWSPSTGLSSTTGSSVTANPASTITYTVTGTTTDGSGCTKTNPVTVTVNERPIAALSGTQEICNGSAATLSLAVTGSGTISGTLSDGTTFSGTAPTITVNVSPSATTTYTISTLTDSKCTAIAADKTGSATVTVNPVPVVTDKTTASCSGAPFTVTPTGVPTGTTYTWTAPTYTGLVSGGSAQSTNQSSITQTLTLNGTNPGTATYTVTPKSGTCTGSSFTVTVTVTANSWNGITSDWSDPKNWCSGVPTATTDVVIPSGVPNYPKLTEASVVRSLELQQGVKNTLNGQKLTIYGSVSGSGEFVGNANSGLVLNGTNTSTLNFDNTTDATTNVLSDLTINTSGTVTLSNKLYIAGTLSLNDGTLNTGDYLTLRSTSIPNTARVAPVSGTINGDVTVERFIPAKRSFRFISPSVTTTTSIKTNWMEGTVNPGVYEISNPKPNYGTNITGNDPTNNGFDPTRTNNPSMFTFNTSTQQWGAVSNTRGNLQAGDAYRLMVRGSRSTEMYQDDNNPTATNTILRATGTLFTGLHTPALSTVNNGYTFIGNPYASPVDFEEMIKYDLAQDKVTGTANNIKPEYTVWDPRLRTRGVYVTYNAVQHANNFIDESSASEVNKNIQSGQAFFVQTSGSSPAIQFQEKYKSTGNTYVFRNPSVRTKLSVQLLLNLNLELENNADGVVSFFDKNFTTAIGNEDSYKFTNLDENLAINHKGISLSMEGRPPVTADDTIQLKIWQFRQKSYYLRLTANNFSPEVTAFVKDNYLHKETSVDLSSVTLFPFSIGTDSASFASNRFSIVFKAATALPVTLTNVKAYQKDQGIQVDWTAEAETNIERYEVEKSVNGQQFDKATAMPAKGNNSVTQNYAWLDENANTGSNFYRIKVIEKSGAEKYSNIVKVNIVAGNSSLTVFPNPIKDNLVKVQFNNMEKGRYSAVLYNTLGQKLYSSTIEHTSRSATYTISLGRLISKGTYTLHITKGDTTINERVIVE